MSIGMDLRGAWCSSTDSGSRNLNITGGRIDIWYVSLRFLPRHEILLTLVGHKWRLNKALRSDSRCESQRNHVGYSLLKPSVEKESRHGSFIFGPSGTIDIASWTQRVNRLYETHHDACLDLCLIHHVHEYLRGALSLGILPAEATSYKASFHYGCKKQETLK